ncbi:hypothetical protein VKT23_007818 [Stygiomarasmius scandens]|uniref:Uncharacterized protein n=1 Tax=Marasmiellus scandens TaxID=2682957 RepID=A0ABR1JIG6_9AGAR
MKSNLSLLLSMLAIAPFFQLQSYASVAHIHRVNTTPTSGDHQITSAPPSDPTPTLIGKRANININNENGNDDISCTTTPPSTSFITNTAGAVATAVKGGSAMCVDLNTGRIVSQSQGGDSVSGFQFPNGGSNSGQGGNSGNNGNNSNAFSCTTTPPSTSLTTNTAGAVATVVKGARSMCVDGNGNVVSQSQDGDSISGFSGGQGSNGSSSSSSSSSQQSSSSEQGGSSQNSDDSDNSSSGSQSPQSQPSGSASPSSDDGDENKNAAVSGRMGIKAWIGIIGAALSALVL